MFGFPHSLAPRLEPLRESFAVDDIEQAIVLQKRRVCL